MAVEVVVPGLGLGWSSGRIIHWYRPDGSQVSRGEPVFCLETDFVAVDVEADADGIVRHRPYDAEAVAAGAVAALILAPGERLPDEPGETPEASADVPAWDVDAPEAIDPAWDAEAPAGVEPVEPPRRYAFERWEATPTDDDDAEDGHGEGGTFDFSTALPSSLDSAETLDASETDAADDAAEVVDAPEPAAILPLRRNTLPPPPPIASDSPWAPVPGDEVAVAGAWNQAPDQPDDDRPARYLWDPPEPPVKHPDEDPRDYFDIAPFARGVTEIHADTIEDSPEPGAAPSFEASEVDDAAVAPPLPAAVLTVRTLVDMREARKMRAQLAREWRSLEPSDEDVILRAAGRALREAGHEAAIALVVPREDGEDVTIGAAAGGFREAVEALRAGGDPGSATSCTLTSFAQHGIDEGTPALGVGHPYAIAAGAVREFAVVDGDRAVPVPMLTLVVAYDPAATTAGRAAAMLGRIRELLEAPYALLAA